MPTLLERYSEPHRHYHTMDHIMEMLGLLANTEIFDAILPNQIALIFAIWYHDAIYVPGQQDNEVSSAFLLAEELADKIDSDTGLDAMRMILSTAKHDPWFIDEEILSDLDLAILGSRPERYVEYAFGVREEFHFVPDATWQTGRAAVLQTFLDQDRIFTFLRDREIQARTNLTLELKALGFDQQG